MFSRTRLVQVLRHYCQTSGTSGPTTPTPAASTGVNTNVPGLTSRCVKTATEPVGPGATATGEYKVPEYFCFNRVSYFEAEVEMAKYRCPQPDAMRK